MLRKGGTQLRYVPSYNQLFITLITHQVMEMLQQLSLSRENVQTSEIQGLLDAIEWPLVRGEGWFGGW